MNKDRMTHVTDPETIAAIERNAFGDPVPVEKTETGYWVLPESLEQYRTFIRDAEPVTDRGSDDGA